MCVILALTVPRDLQDHPHPGKIAWLPLASGITGPLDVVANLALYLPLGYLAPGRTGRRRLLLAVLASTALASAAEISQAWSHSRFPSPTDFLMNIAGGAIGAILATRGLRSAARHEQGHSAP
jgi:VanZ family protein